MYDAHVNSANNDLEIQQNIKPQISTCASKHCGFGVTNAVESEPLRFLASYRLYITLS